MESKPETKSRRFTREHAKLIVAVLAAIVLAVVFAQNLEQARVSILFMTITMPLAVMLIATAMIGYVIGILSASILRRRRSKNQS